MSSIDPRAGLPPARSAGLLLHPTSLPTPFGIGDLGPSAVHWINQLADAGVAWWQVLPLGPTGYGDSPYQSFSTFAGNPYLISPERLIEDGLIDRQDCEYGDASPDRVDYGRIIPFKQQLLDLAWERFQGGRAGHLRGLFDTFVQREADWLESYVLFMALKDSYGGRPWNEWDNRLRLHDPVAVSVARYEQRERMDVHRFQQFLFFRQWTALQAYAHERGVRLVGDVPIFVALDSADVWANPHYFLLDSSRRPTVVAGVPPDYFSATGQLWGNPLYDWEAIRADDYRWWLARLGSVMKMVDLVRLDHFRGFEAAWHVPHDAPTAESGSWVPGPADEFLRVVRDHFGGLPLIAEDLGEITPPVRAMRDRFNLPGMRIIQYAFDKPDNIFLPHNYVPNTVVYTGTHDNDTTLGWYQSLTPAEREIVNRYTGGSTEQTICWQLIQMAWASVAQYAIVPLQDLLQLPTEARMNYPGRPSGNWQWRFTDYAPVHVALGRLQELTERYNRSPESKSSP